MKDKTMTEKKTIEQKAEDNWRFTVGTTGEAPLPFVMGYQAGAKEALQPLHDLIREMEEYKDFPENNIRRMDAEKWLNKLKEIL